MTFSDFFDAFGEFDWLAIIVGTAVFVAVGWLWYGPLFGKAWSSATGQPMQSGTPDTGKLIATIIYSLVFNIGLAFTSVGPDDFEHSLVAGGIVLGALLVGSASYAGVVWAGHHRTAWMIDLLFIIVAATLSTFVQGLIVS